MQFPSIFKSSHFLPTSDHVLPQPAHTSKNPLFDKESQITMIFMNEDTL